MCERHYQRQRKLGSTDSPFIDQWTRYTEDAAGCWLWDGPTYSNGYAKLSRIAHDTRLAHRAFYMRVNGFLNSKIDLDHLCRVRHCVNPAHLEPVSRSTNLLRGRYARELCRKGLHDAKDPANQRPTKTGWECKPCWRDRYRAAGQKYRDRLKAETGCARPR